MSPVLASKPSERVMPSESEIISRVRNRARPGRGVIVGVGDDAAVIKVAGDKDLIACCDLMIEGVHFRAKWAPPRLIGRKALAACLSDVAAMGGVPRFAMISIALPEKCSSAFIDELFSGLFELADAHAVSIVGGDTSSSRDWLFMDVSVLGECESGRAVARRGARPGDVIYVTGSLGASACGLRLLEDGFRLEASGDIELPKDESDAARRQALMKHLVPEPQLKMGHAIGEAGLATAMIDISDGLSTDLWHILDESNCGAVVHAAALPIAECVVSLGAAADPVALALESGEEYELLFTSRPESERQLAELADGLGVRLTTIGEIVETRGLRLERNGALESLEPSGYEHLISSS